MERKQVAVSLRKDYLFTTFHPPIHEKQLFESTTSAFSIHEIVRDSKNIRSIRGVVYAVGERSDFEENISKLRTEIEDATGYEVSTEALNIGSIAVRQASVA